MKKGIELSINFLVMVIFSITVLGFGLWLASSMFGNAQEFNAEINQQTQNQINSLLASGSRVAIPMNKADVKIGKTKVFGLGVFNSLEEESNGTNTYNFDKFFVEITPNNPSDIGILPEDKEFTLPYNNNELIPIAVSVKNGASKGIKPINVEVCFKNTNPSAPENGDCTITDKIAGDYFRYGTQKIYVTVK